MARKKMRSLGELVDLLKQIPADVFENIRDTRPPQEREGPVEMFAAKNKPFDEELRIPRKRKAKAKP